MGCASPRNVEMNNHFQHPNVQRYLQIMRLDHPLNVNKKYEHLCKIYDKQFTGSGYKKTNAYDCPTTQIQLNLKRKQFWQTRTNGKKECWIGLQLAVQSQSQEQGYAILQQVGLTLLQNSVQMAVDQRGNKYDVPIFCINLPKTFSKTTLAETNINTQYEQKEIEIKIRSTRFVADTILKESNGIMVIDLKQKFRVKNNLSDLCTFRFFYNGKQILDHYCLGNYNFREQEVIQAMIIGG